MSWVASVTALRLSIMNQPAVCRVPPILTRTTAAGLYASYLSLVVFGPALKRDARPATTRGELVQGFDSDREADSGVDIPLRHVQARAVGDQRHADQQQEAQRQHLHGRVAIDETGNRPRSAQ